MFLLGGMIPPPVWSHVPSRSRGGLDLVLGGLVPDRGVSGPRGLSHSPLTPSGQTTCPQLRLRAVIKCQQIWTRMHSSRLRTDRLLPVSPSMHCSGGCTWSGGPGVYLVLRGVPGLGVYLVWGVYLVQGVYLAWGQCTWSGGVPGRGCTWSGGCTCPGTPPCEQNDKQVQKYYLAPRKEWPTEFLPDWHEVALYAFSPFFGDNIKIP